MSWEVPTHVAPGAPLDPRPSDVGSTEQELKLRSCSNPPQTGDARPLLTSRTVLAPRVRRSGDGAEAHTFSSQRHARADGAQTADQRAPVSGGLGQALEALVDGLELHAKFDAWRGRI